MLRPSFVLLTLISASPLAAQTTVETLSFWDGSSSVQPFGKANTGTYGQTFTVPGSDNLMQSFSFFLRDISSANELIFQGYVARWDAATSRITGSSALYQ